MAVQQKNNLWRGIVDSVQVVSAAGVMGILVVIGGYKEKIDRVVKKVEVMDESNRHDHQQIKNCVVKLGSDVSMHIGTKFDYLPQ